jgi:hypothetical protein
MERHSTVGHGADERQRGEDVTELARSRKDTAPLGTAPTSAGEEKT